jgi:hypothetical protein
MSVGSNAILFDGQANYFYVNIFLNLLNLNVKFEFSLVGFVIRISVLAHEPRVNVEKVEESAVT